MNSAASTGKVTRMSRRRPRSRNTAFTASASRPASRAARSSSIGRRTRSPVPRAIEDADIAERDPEIRERRSSPRATRSWSCRSTSPVSIGSHDASIFDAHLLVVEDRTLIDEVLRTLQRDKTGIEFVFAQVAESLRQDAERNRRPVPARARPRHPRRDPARDPQSHGQGRPRPLRRSTHPHVLVAHNLTPSDTAQLNRNYVLGFATDIGSKTSHTAIMARSLNIPAVVGLHDLSTRSRDRRPRAARWLQRPRHRQPHRPDALGIRRAGSRRRVRSSRTLSQLRETECKTLDGRHVILSANIESPQDMDLVRQSGAEGVGLYRTEFFYLNRAEPAERGGPVPGVSRGGRTRCCRSSGHHPHARPRRRQVDAVAQSPRGDSIPSSAGAPSGSASSGPMSSSRSSAPSSAPAPSAMSA